MWDRTEIRYDFIGVSVMQLYIYFLKQEKSLINLLQLIRASLDYHLILIMFLSAYLSLEKNFSSLHNMM